MSTLTTLGSSARPSAAPHTPAFPWRACYRVGAVAAVVGVVGTLTDIGLTALPGWGPDSVPTDAAGWCTQLTGSPWLGLRNLDLLNAVLAVVALPTYLAIVLALGRGRRGIAGLGLLLAVVGATVFVAGNAALPMLELSAACPAAGEPLAGGLDGAMQAVLARGAHGSYGALPGFLLSELGTAVLAGAMLGSRAFGRFTPWAGLVGIAGLTAYTLASTLTGAVTAAITLLAIPAGIAMLGFTARVAAALWRLAATAPSEDPR